MSYLRLLKINKAAIQQDSMTLTFEDSKVMLEIKFQTLLNDFKVNPSNLTKGREIVIQTDNSLEEPSTERFRQVELLKLIELPQR